MSALADCLLADALVARLWQIQDELHHALEMLPDVFEDMSTPDARYCRYNLQNAALAVAVAANRITSPTGSAPVEGDQPA